ncbi:hypothetical protein MTO96_025404 [Rhipicephalus appendiculatus]
MAVNATHLRVTVAASPPWVKAEYEDGRYHVSGIFGHLLQALADFVPFSFDVTYDSERSFGIRLEDGNFTGIVGLLQRGEVDIAASPVFLRPDRFEVVGYGPVLYNSECTLIAVAGEPSVNAFGYLFVFDWQAWAVIIASVPLMATALALVERRRPGSGNSFVLEAYDNIWDILSSFAYKGHTTNTESYAGRLLLSFWWLLVLVLTNEFAGHLMASIAIKSEPPRLRSVEDVAYQTSIRPLIWKDTAFDTYIRTTTTITVYSVFSISRSGSLHGRMIAFMESGLRLEWYYSGVKEWHLCRDMQRSGSSKAGVLSYEVLSYDGLAAIFVLWGIMTMFSLVVFLLEICFHKTRAPRCGRFRSVKVTSSRRCLSKCLAEYPHVKESSLG